MKEKAVIFECSADAIIDIRKRLDEIAFVTNGSIWFETIGQNAINGNGPSLTKYSIICHYPESQMEIRDKYYDDKVRSIQNTFKSELDSVRNKLNKYAHIIQALTGRPVDEIVKSWDICDNGFGVNYRFNPNGHSTLDISMSRTKREVLLEKENEELKKRLKSAEQSDYVAPLRDRVDVCEENIKDNWYELQQVRKDVTDLVNTVCDDNRTINNTLNELNIRLKAIEKRLSIKPFYEPTEDEKDD